MIKTDAEIERFPDRRAPPRRVFAEVFPTIRAGEREREVHGRMIGGCLAAGAEFAHGILNSHRNPVIYCGESDFVLERGDIVRTDYLAYVEGYPGHQSRNAVIGPPSPSRSPTTANTQHLPGDCGPAAPGGHGGRALRLRGRAASRGSGGSTRPGFVGHSVGPWWHQQEPIFCRGSRVPLEPGMVVALEPYLDHWHCQDLFLITDAGPELLSPDFDTTQMFVIE